MSDNLRIRGQSAGGFGGKREGSLARFKQGRKAGDLVRGVFLRLEPASPGTAWVNLEGEELLAQLPEELSDLARRILAGRGVGAMPTGLDESDFPLRPGSPCYFILEALDPEPVLRMLSQKEQGAGDSGMSGLLDILGLSGLAAGEAGALGAPGASGTTGAAGATYGANGTFGAGGNAGAPVSGSLLVALHLAEQQAGLSWRNLTALPPVQLAARYAVSRASLDNLLQKRLWPAVKAMPAQPLERLQLYRRFVRDDAEALERYTDLSLHRTALVRDLRSHGLRDMLFVPWLRPGCLSMDLALLHGIFILQARLPQGPRVEIRGQSANGAIGSQRLLPPGEDDLLSFLLGLYPDGARGGFSRRT